MGYSDNPEMVRVDFFKPGGKWYCTEAIEFSDYTQPDIFFAFAKALTKHLKGRLSEMDAVCLNPYHINGHPLQLKGGEWINYKTDFRV